MRPRAARTLTASQTFALAIGPKHGEEFADEADAREAWREHGPAMVAASALGRRPAGWWRWESDRPDLDDDGPLAEARRLEYLVTHPDVLRPGEARAIVREARADLEYLTDPEARGWPPPTAESVAADAPAIPVLRRIVRGRRG